MLYIVRLGLRKRQPRIRYASMQPPPTPPLCILGNPHSRYGRVQSFEGVTSCIHGVVSCHQKPQYAADIAVRSEGSIADISSLLHTQPPTPTHAAVVRPLRSRSFTHPHTHPDNFPHIPIVIVESFNGIPTSHVAVLFLYHFLSVLFFTAGFSPPVSTTATVLYSFLAFLNRACQTRTSMTPF